MPSAKGEGEGGTGVYPEVVGWIGVRDPLLPLPVGEGQGEGELPGHSTPGYYHGVPPGHWSLDIFDKGRPKRARKRPNFSHRNFGE